ncbi:MAG: AbrB/MazE/SpoVT family DNA-binding domain-containing protein [Clostridia bacterium]|nr:AbrB/MazE/SpoVT family DNA-binding domain-containing protein [Clostridia bacterium]
MEIKIIRKMDSLGRIVIPKDIRKTLDIKPADTVEITVRNNAVILKKRDK